MYRSTIFSPMAKKLENKHTTVTKSEKSDFSEKSGQKNFRSYIMK